MEYAKDGIRVKCPSRPGASSRRPASNRETPKDVLESLSPNGSASTVKDTYGLQYVPEPPCRRRSLGHILYVDAGSHFGRWYGTKGGRMKNGSNSLVSGAEVASGFLGAGPTWRCSAANRESSARFSSGTFFSFGNLSVPGNARSSRWRVETRAGERGCVSQGTRIPGEEITMSSNKRFRGEYSEEGKAAGDPQGRRGLVHPAGNGSTARRNVAAAVNGAELAPYVVEKRKPLLRSSKWSARSFLVAGGLFSRSR